MQSINTTGQVTRPRGGQDNQGAVGKTPGSGTRRSAVQSSPPLVKSSMTPMEAPLHGVGLADYVGARGDARTHGHTGWSRMPVNERDGARRLDCFPRLHTCPVMSGKGITL